MATNTSLPIIVSNISKKLFAKLSLLILLLMVVVVVVVGGGVAVVVLDDTTTDDCRNAKYGYNPIPPNAVLATTNVHAGNGVLLLLGLWVIGCNIEPQTNGKYMNELKNNNENSAYPIGGALLITVGSNKFCIKSKSDCGNIVPSAPGEVYEYIFSPINAVPKTTFLVISSSSLVGDVDSALFKFEPPPTLCNVVAVVATAPRVNGDNGAAARNASLGHGANSNNNVRRAPGTRQLLYQ